ncbi:Scytalone dehydratase [Penicillium chermesinum]|uniref:Scytalone dehydratase n=1 Tax=Penicillium chermesinum TaxID=63820 RepID=A0A9W9P7C1_9EURO|nr:Scytalone dehydratase [Penicillium chermesinum]KAJ5239010.1 Scytalone dehydratase [Penicillium chermesinum]
MEKLQVRDYVAFGQLAFEWADSCDIKVQLMSPKLDFRSRGLFLTFYRTGIDCAISLPPTLLVDYSMIGHERLPKVSAEDFVAMIASPKLLGHPLVRTQNLIGAVRYNPVCDEEIGASYQIRAAHQRYEDPDHTSVTLRGHGYGKVTHWYKKMDGDWKLSGIRLEMYWSEASGSASDGRHAIAEFAHYHPTDPVDVIIADFMSEFNMATAAGRRVNQGTAPQSSTPAYDL